MGLSWTSQKLLTFDHDLLIAKQHSYGFDNKFLKSYQSDGKGRKLTLRTVHGQN